MRYFTRRNMSFFRPCVITSYSIHYTKLYDTVVLSHESKHRAGSDLITELQNHVKEVTAPYKYPRVIEFVEELPKTISGKIRRVEIRAKDTL